jgi:hypothetical protein
MMILWVKNFFFLSFKTSALLAWEGSRWDWSRELFGFWDLGFCREILGFLGFSLECFFWGLKRFEYFFVGRKVVLGFFGGGGLFCRVLGFVVGFGQREGLVAACGVIFLDDVFVWWKWGCDRRAPIPLVFRLFFARGLLVVKLVPVDEPRVLVCNPFLAIFHLFHYFILLSQVLHSKELKSVCEI